MPQPNFVPVRLSSSRSAHSSGISGSISSVCVWPLTLSVTAMVLSRMRSKTRPDSGRLFGRGTVPQPLMGPHYSRADITRLAVFAGLGYGRQRETLHVRACNGDRVGAKPYGVAHALKLPHVRSTPEAVLLRVHRGDRLPRLRFRTGRLPPRLPAANERRL